MEGHEVGWLIDDEVLIEIEMEFECLCEERDDVCGVLLNVTEKLLLIESIAILLDGR